MSLINCLPLYLFEHIAGFLDDSMWPWTPFKKHKLVARRAPCAMFVLSACSRSLRQLLLPLLFASLRITPMVSETVIRYRVKLQWILRKGSHLLGFVRCVQLNYKSPNPEETMLTDCLSRMINLEELHFTQDLSRAFIPTLLALPRLHVLTVNLPDFPAPSFFPNLLRLAPKLDCFQFITSVPQYLNEPIATKTVIDGVAEVLLAFKDRIETLHFGFAFESSGNFSLDHVLRRATEISGGGGVEFPRLKFLFTGSRVGIPLLQNLFATSPYLTGLGMVNIPQRDVISTLPSLPLLRSFSYGGLGVPKRCPHLLLSVLREATPKRLQLSGLSPLDISDILSHSSPHLASSLLSLRLRIHPEHTLRPDHFDKLATLCRNLQVLELDCVFDADPICFFRTLSRLSRLAYLEFTDPLGTLEKFNADGSVNDRYLRTSHDIAPSDDENEHEWLERAERLIKADMQLVKPLVFVYIGQIAKLTSLETIVWRPTSEIRWRWEIDRDPSGALSYRDYPDVVIRL